MQIVYSPEAYNDLNYWVKTNNKIVLKKIVQLTKAIIENPTSGIGKPEQLKHQFTGYWSRRIDQEHRIVYKFNDSELTIVSLRGHYLK